MPSRYANTEEFIKVQLLLSVIMPTSESLTLMFDAETLLDLRQLIAGDAKLMWVWFMFPCPVLSKVNPFQVWLSG